jgi:hypothetical protein
MARPCSICIRTDVFRIDAALRDGEPYRQIANRLALSKSTLARHWAHLKKGVRKFNGDSEAALRSFDLEVDEILRGMLDLPRQPVASSRVFKRKTASGRRRNASNGSKKC